MTSKRPKGPNLRQGVYHWDAEKIEELKRLYARRVELDLIAEVLGVSPGSVSSKLRSLQIRRKKRSTWPAERIEELKAMLAEGKSYAAIGAHFGLPRGSIGAAVHQHKLQGVGHRRTRGDHDGAPWTDEEYQRARSLRDAGMSIEEIAKQLGRVAPAVAMRLDPPEPLPDRAPPEVVAARTLMIAARDRRCITATLMGDPPPGYSALDRIRGQS